MKHDCSPFSETASTIDLLETRPNLPLEMPPPTYDDAVRDSPPEYTPFAQKKDLTPHLIFEGIPSKARIETSIFPNLPGSEVLIDLNDSRGLRQRKGGKKKKQASAWPAPGENDKQGQGAEEGQNGSGAGGDGGGNSDGNGAGGGGGDDGDDWGEWSLGGSKKSKKKKKQEEEEKKRKEEEEKKAKDEEERRSTEAAAEAAAQSNGNNLSWADEMEAAGDDDWAGFATVGKKKKNKKGKVRSSTIFLSSGCLIAQIGCRDPCHCTCRCFISRCQAC